MATGSVLFLSHNGLTEPLGRRQVLPYLVGLSARGWSITVISFEKASTASLDARSTVEGIARASGIVWRPLRYHRRPPLVSTGFDVLRGWSAGRRLGCGATLIHARSTVPALMARLLSRDLGAPWIFDVRGFLGEEYVDAGHWGRDGLRHRVTASVEKRLLLSADGVVTLTRKALGQIPSSCAPGAERPIRVIPCSVDLGVFQPSQDWRREVRAELGWGDEPAIVYSGSLGSWYGLEQMLDFFVAARQQIAGLRFLVLTPQPGVAAAAALAKGLNRSVTALSLPPDSVPRYLAAADVGICFLGRHPSKEASSPTTYGEYLASGLPVLTNSWTGDARDLADEPSWIMIDAFDADQYRQAALRLAELLERPGEARSAARGLARREFALDTAIDRYHDLYMKVLGR